MTRTISAKNGTVAHVEKVIEAHMSQMKLPAKPAVSSLAFNDTVDPRCSHEDRSQAKAG